MESKNFKLIQNNGEWASMKVLTFSGIQKFKDITSWPITRSKRLFDSYNKSMNVIILVDTKKYKEYTKNRVPVKDRDDNYLYGLVVNSLGDIVEMVRINGKWIKDKEVEDIIKMTKLDKTKLKESVINRGKSSLKESSYSDFIMDYGKDVKEMLNTIKKISKSWESLPEDEIESRAEKIGEKLKIYDRVVQAEVVDLFYGSNISLDTFADMAIRNQDSTGTDLQQPVNALADAIYVAKKLDESKIKRSKAMKNQRIRRPVKEVKKPVTKQKVKIAESRLRKIVREELEEAGILDKAKAIKKHGVPISGGLKGLKGRYDFAKGMDKLLKSKLSKEEQKNMQSLLWASVTETLQDNDVERLRELWLKIFDGQINEAYLGFIWYPFTEEDIEEEE